MISWLHSWLLVGFFTFANLHLSLLLNDKKFFFSYLILFLVRVAWATSCGGWGTSYNSGIALSCPWETILFQGLNLNCPQCKARVFTLLLSLRSWYSLKPRQEILSSWLSMPWISGFKTAVLSFICSWPKGSFELNGLEIRPKDHLFLAPVHLQANTWSLHSLNALPKVRHISSEFRVLFQAEGQ